MTRLGPYVIAAAIALALPAHADNMAPLPEPQEDIVLTVSGLVAQTNVGTEAVFDMEMLKALPVTSFVTSTIWTEGVREFTGVQLSDLLALTGADGETLKATAINDYAVDIPVSDAVEGGPILAYEIDGAEMSVRERGPLWVVYPYDHNGEYRSETIYSRSIWQLTHIEVME